MIYVVTCPVCQTQNTTDEPGSEEEKVQEGASIQCTQCGSTVSAYGGQVRSFAPPVEAIEQDLFGLNEL